MITLEAKSREILGKKVRKLKENGILPGVLYGSKVKNSPLEINLKDFEKAYKEAGGSSLISLELDGKKILVLIHDVKFHPVTDKPIHADFYQPKLDEEIEATVPLVFEGAPLAVKDLGGTLVKNIHEVVVKALPQNLPHEIKVNIDSLKTFEDSILIKDLILPDNVKVKKDADEIVILAKQPSRVEEELEKPVEEKVDEVEKVEGKKKDEGEVEVIEKKEESKDEKK